MNRNTRSHPKPTPICASFAAILPVLDEPATDARLAAGARDHLAACAYCQAQMADYYRLDTAMRRSLSPSGTPHPRTEDIMSKLIDDIGGDQPATKAAAPLRLPPREPRPGRVGHFLSGLAALAAVLVIVLLTAAIFASHAHTAGPGIPPPTATARASAPVQGYPFKLIPGSYTELNAVSMLSAGEGWAVGAQDTTGNSMSEHTMALVAHYSNGVWLQINPPAKGRLTGISMVSASDGWAVGDQGLMLHFDGHTWKKVNNPIQGDIARVQMLSATNGWAIVEHPGSIWHYDGRSWSQQPLPTSLSGAVVPFALSMISPTEGWVVGNYFPGQPALAAQARFSNGSSTNAIILHYTNGQWVLENQFQGADLRSVSMASASEGWAVGSIFVNQNPLPLLLHYTAGKWAQAANPPGTNGQLDEFDQIVMNTPTDGWLGGVDGIRSGIPQLLHYTNGQWIATRAPSIQDTVSYIITGISMTSTAQGWAVGSRISGPQEGKPAPSGQSFQPTNLQVFLHYDAGVWSVVQS